jgi:phosphoserine phosphatase
MHYEAIMQRIAIYDMDRTLTKVATFTPYLFRTALRFSPLRLLLFPVAIMAAAGHWLLAKAGLHAGDYRVSIKQAGLQLVGGFPLSESETARRAAAYAEHVTTSNVYKDALDQIEAERKQGFTLVMATASNDIYALEIGKRLGFDAVLCTQNARGPLGKILPCMASANCYGAEKLRRVEAWLTEAAVDRAAAHIRFYSDHVTDAPCLEWADEAFATNPHARLRALANVRGWPILNWR